jgi:Amt family ammonium transporter
MKKMQNAKCKMQSFGIKTILTIATLLLSNSVAFASEASRLDSGDTAWILVATALVLFMTLPGLDVYGHGEQGYIL